MATSHPLSNRTGSAFTLITHSLLLLLCTSVLTVSNGSATHQNPMPANAPDTNEDNSDGGVEASTPRREAI